MPSTRSDYAKSINIALQGGGSHGAFTWGVLDRLFEDGRIWIAAISGASAGAMNAVVAAQGMFDGGDEGARAALADFWRKVSDVGSYSPIRRGPLDILMGNWSMEFSPAYIYADLMQRLASPYDLNPLDIDPLRDLVAEEVDFAKVRNCHAMPIFLSATNVETGTVRVFSREEITIDTVMASACLPFMYKAVEIDGVPYWDGGYSGNPPLFPFYDASPSDDVMIVRINPVVRPGAPRSAREILNRINEITFNSSLLKELRAINFVHRLLEDGKISRADYRDVKIHIIGSDEEMTRLGASSKMNTEWAFLTHLRDIGRKAADDWLAAHFDDLGERSTVDLPAMFQGRPDIEPERD